MLHSKNPYEHDFQTVISLGQEKSVTIYNSKPNASPSITDNPLLLYIEFLSCGQLEE